MKKIIFPILAIAGLFFILQSCDKINEPYLELVRVDTGGGGSGTSKRVLLLEDFTGHKCVNCPEASLLARNLKLAHDGQVVLISVHAGYFATPDITGQYTADFRTTEGEAFNSYYGILSNPAGLINRSEFSGKKILSPDKWETIVNEELLKPVEAGISIESTYNADTRALHLIVSTTFLKDFSEDLLLSVGITESDIISPQKNNNPAVGTTPDILNYSHQHVLRGMVNGSWGQLIKTGGVQNGEKIEKTFDYTLPGTWNPEKCSVIAYVMYADGVNKYKVIQATEAEVSGK
jgi:hypothetical protein